MYNFLTKNGQTVAFALGGLIVGIFLLQGFVIDPASDFPDMAKETQYQSTIFDFGILSSMWLARLCAVLIAAFGIYHIATNFKNSVKGIIGVAILGVIFAIGYYALADTSITPAMQGAIDKFESAQGAKITEDTLKLMGGGIWTTLILLGLAVVAFVVGEVRNFFN